MLFDSIPFLCIFLPAVWIAVQALGLLKAPSFLIVSALIAASLYFYASVHGIAIGLFVVLAVVNFVLGRALVSLDPDAPRRGRLLAFGVLVNAGCLLAFKYLWRTPVGLSFFIFVQIGYLVDAAQDNVPPAAPINYLLFSLWFPYLLSGPIVKAEEVLPQVGRFRASAHDLAIGLSYLLMGLFKKVVLAAMAANVATPFFLPGSPWVHTGAPAAWLGVFAFTLQIYFDFSGYSDMAIGIARLFGVRLPVNFNSPLKATNISDFWYRSHMTLTRFLMFYIYNPLALALTRARMTLAGTRTVQRGRMSAGEFLLIVAFPMIATMFIAGIWHGAGWTFAIFGLMHGVYLASVHGWHQIKKYYSFGSGNRFGRPLAHVLTLTALTASLVFFGAPHLAHAAALLRSMAGCNGLHGPTPAPLGPTAATLAVLACIVFFLPNSQEWLSRDEQPVFPLPRAATAPPTFLQRWLWQPEMRYALVWTALAIPSLVAILASPSPSGFIYFKF